MKTTEDLLFGAENKAAAAKAVQAAVTRADAVGLFPAFQPYMTLATVFPRPIILAIRRQELAITQGMPRIFNLNIL
jgi:uncharacterized protein (DUF2062 family)